jgi:hypothetical protein
MSADHRKPLNAHNNADPSANMKAGGTSVRGPTEELRVCSLSIQHVRVVRNTQGL